jgi:hypothetical protein
MVYETPVVTDLGSIADHTFMTPGGVKGCQRTATWTISPSSRPSRPRRGSGSAT